MHMRKLTGTIHNRDKLMGIAFDGIGSLPMATIDKFREMRAKDFAAGGGGGQGTAAGGKGSGRCDGMKIMVWGSRWEWSRRRPGAGGRPELAEDALMVMTVSVSRGLFVSCNALQWMDATHTLRAYA